MKINTSQTTFDPVEEGVWEADITRMYDTQEFNNFTKTQQEVIRVEFTIVEGEMRERKAFRSVTPSLSPKSILWAIWKGVKKGEPSPEELAAIGETEDVIEQLGGKPVKIVVKNKTSQQGKQYYIVSDFLKSTRVKGEFPFVAGAPEGSDYAKPSVAGHVTETEEGASMAEVAEEVFGNEAGNAGVAQATPKKVV